MRISDFGSGTQRPALFIGDGTVRDFLVALGHYCLLDGIIGQHLAELGRLVVGGLLFLPGLLRLRVYPVGLPGGPGLMRGHSLTSQVQSREASQWSIVSKLTDSVLETAGMVWSLSGKSARKASTSNDLLRSGDTRNAPPCPVNAADGGDYAATLEASPLEGHIGAGEIIRPNLQATFTAGALAAVLGSSTISQSAAEGEGVVHRVVANNFGHLVLPLGGQITDRFPLLVFLGYDALVLVHVQIPFNRVADQSVQHLRLQGVQLPELGPI